jgi:PKD domain-containing protein
VRFAPALVACVAATLVFAGVAQAHRLEGLIRDVPSRSTPAEPWGPAIAPGDRGAHIARLYGPMAHVANLPYGGGPVLHSNRTHVIFWQPAGSGLTFEPGYESLIETFLRNVAADSRSGGSVYGLTGQYTDAQGPAAYVSSYGGAVVARDPLPPNGCTEPSTGPGWSVCLTDEQLQREIEHVMRTDDLPTGPTDVYFLVTPNGLGDCEDSSSTACALGGDATGYCAYHSQTDDGLVLYAVIPYNAVPPHCDSGNPRPNRSTADPALSTISHEHSEMVTDPVGNAWVDSSGNEVGDLCLTSFGPNLGGSGATAWNEVIHGGHYYLQEEWSNADRGCEPRAKPDVVSFKDTALARVGAAVPFSARARAGHGAIVAYRWFFGDGRMASGRGTSHRFDRSGVFRVILRATDSWGNWAFYSHLIGISRS